MTSTPTQLEPVSFNAKLVVQAGRVTPLLNPPLLEQVAAGQPFCLQSYPLHGSISLEPNGSLVYVAMTGYVGPDRFSYSVGDPDNSAGALYTVMVEVTHSSLVAESARWARFALRNDTLLVLPEAAMLRSKADEPIDGLRVESIEQPKHGTVIQLADGSYLYTPLAGYVGDDVFEYMIIDGRGRRAVVLVKLNLSAPTAAPSIELVPAESDEVCERLLNNSAEGALLPILQGLTTPDSEVTVVVDGRAVACVSADKQGHWRYSTELISPREASHLQAYVQMQDGTAAATPRLSTKVQALGTEGSGYWAHCTSRGTRSAYHGRGTLGQDGNHRSMPAWAERSFAGPTGWE